MSSHQNYASNYICHPSHSLLVASFSTSSLVISLLNTLDGWFWKRLSSKSLSSLMVSLPLLHESATYAENGESVPVGGFPMSIICPFHKQRRRKYHHATLLHYRWSYKHRKSPWKTWKFQSYVQQRRFKGENPSFVPVILILARISIRLLSPLKNTNARLLKPPAIATSYCRKNALAPQCVWILHFLN